MTTGERALLLFLAERAEAQLKARDEGIRALIAQWRQSGHWWRCQGGNTFEMEAHVRQGDTLMKCADQLASLLSQGNEDANKGREVRK